jgi:hypothetical protein
LPAITAPAYLDTPLGAALEIQQQKEREAMFPLTKDPRFAHLLPLWRVEAYNTYAPIGYGVRLRHRRDGRVVSAEAATIDEAVTKVLALAPTT